MSDLTPVPVVLTPDEAELLRCWRTMDLRRRDQNMKMCQRDAENYPMVRRPVTAAPRGLRLVVGGAA